MASETKDLASPPPDFAEAGPPSPPGFAEAGPPSPPDFSEAGPPSPPGLAEAGPPSPPGFAPPGAPPPMAAGAPPIYVSMQQPQVQVGAGYANQQPAGFAQPGQVQWMPLPEPIIGCPPGLEYLTQIDQLLVHQQVELFELLTNFETENRYQVKNSVGQQIYFAHEESSLCERQWCGGKRGFIMHITDNMNQEVLRLTREFKCCVGCCWCANCDCAAADIAVEAPVGNVIGYVRQSQSWWYPNFTVMNVAKESVFKIGGPFWFCQNACCTDDIEFKITSPDMDMELGKLSKQWGGLIKEAYTKADNFTITFPMDMTVDMKACLLGAIFLVDFMFFERPKNINQQRH